MIRKIVLAVFLFILPASAANAAAICRLSATDVDFGEFTGSTADTGAIVISCVGTGNVDYVVKLSKGNSGTYNTRQMRNGTAALLYNLFSQSTLSSIWGDGTGASTVVAGTIRMGNNLVVTTSLPVFGRVPIQTAPAPGIYRDSIEATMTYSGPTATSSFQVLAHVSPHCAISATDLNFGSYTQVQLDGQSEIQVTCTGTTLFNVGLDGGRTGSVSRRDMSGLGLSRLDYQLYSNSARTTVWGDRVGNDTVPGIGNGVSQTLTVYGRIPSGQRPSGRGGYTDTITATLTF